jgi:hypothetical protein
MGKDDAQIPLLMHYPFSSSLLLHEIQKKLSLYYKNILLCLSICVPLVFVNIVVAATTTLG